MSDRAYSDVDEQLIRLAAILDAPLRIRLIALAQADSKAGQIIELEHQTRRAEDLVAEIRRQMASLERRHDRVTRLLESPDATLEQLRADLNVRARDRAEFSASKVNQT